MGRDWNFYADIHLSRGGCRVETDQSQVNYSVEQRLRSMLEQANFLGELGSEEVIPVQNYEPPQAELPPASAEPSASPDFQAWPQVFPADDSLPE
jgi:hypothetical protein